MSTMSHIAHIGMHHWNRRAGHVAEMKIQFEWMNQQMNFKARGKSKGDQSLKCQTLEPRMKERISCVGTIREKGPVVMLSVHVQI